MLFTPTKLAGAWIIDLKRIEDARGYFARSWCEQEFRQHGLTAQLSQRNTGFSHKRGTLRGMHFQQAPDLEAKVVSCGRGAVHDVIVDLRAGSPTFCQWLAVELTAQSGRMLYVPEGFAHGYQTLADDTELQYLATVPYAPKSARGVRFDDPAFGITWPLPVSVISDADMKWPDFDAREGGLSMSTSKPEA